MKLTQHDIGGEIISILTKGMYSDPKDALREYVQNGVDANAPTIDIKIRQNNIVIEDTGNGMDKIAMRRAVRLGISDKNPGKAVGFMGIGLYSSFHLCDRLIIHSKIENQKPNKLEFEFKNMRLILEAQKEARIVIEEGVTDQIALLALMESNTNLTELDESDYPVKGTRVELNGCDADFFESLSKFDEVAEYLEKSIPLPFDPAFKYGNEIQQYIKEKCEEHSAEFKLVELKLQINSKTEQLFRPYKDTDFSRGPMPPIYKELKAGDEFFGIAWGVLNTANEVIKKDDVRGFLIKKQGFTIGTRNNLLSTFGAKFFNRYVGEIIIVNPRLLPNGARSDFEYSSLRTILKKTIDDTAAEFNLDANRHQEIEKAESDLDKLIELYRSIEGDFNGLAQRKDLLLDTYSTLNKAFNNFKRKSETVWKIKEDRKKDTEEILILCAKLISELSELLLQKKTPSKRTPLKNRTQIAFDLTSAPLPHDIREPEPHNLIELIELIGIPFNDDIRIIFSLIDDLYIKPHSVDADEYIQQLLRLKEDFEENFLSNED